MPDYFRLRNLDIFGFIEKDVFLGILEKHGAEHVLFATDSPWSGQRESLEYVRGLPVPREQLDQIIGGNAERLLGE